MNNDKNILKILFVILALRFVTGCVTLKVLEEGDGPPDSEEHLLETEDAIPRREVYSAYGNPEQYEVFGKTYRVLESDYNYVAKGIASWYGKKFHGRRTSSGEPYNMFKMSAAHKTLPIPCYVKVTNLDNNQSVIVRVNDRGPFHDDRIIDLSYAAARKIGVFESGTAPVQVEAISDGPEVDELGQFVIQIGAYSSLAQAKKIQEYFRKAEQLPVKLMSILGNQLVRVRMGPIRSKRQALQLIKKYQQTPYASMSLVRGEVSAMTQHAEE